MRLGESVRILSADYSMFEKLVGMNERAEEPSATFLCDFVNFIASAVGQTQRSRKGKSLLKLYNSAAKKQLLETVLLKHDLKSY